MYQTAGHAGTTNAAPAIFVVGNSLMLKSEYGGQGYCDSGEAYCGGDSDEVQPVSAIWQELEE